MLDLDLLVHDDLMIFVSLDIFLVNFVEDLI